MTVVNDGFAAAGIRTERLSRLFAYWQEKRGEAAMPSRAAISPFDFTYILGDVVLLEVHREPLRFRYRLHGVNLVARDHYDMTGKWLDDNPEPDYRARIHLSCSAVVASGAPLCAEREILVDERVRRYEALVLPLGANGIDVDMLLGAQAYLD